MPSWAGWSGGPIAAERPRDLPSNRLSEHSQKPAGHRSGPRLGSRMHPSTAAHARAHFGPCRWRPQAITPQPRPGPRDEWIHARAAQLHQFIDHPLYIYVIIAGAIMSWLIAFNVVNPYNQFVRSIWQGLNAVTEPLLRPIRRWMPDLGGIDISPMVLILLCCFIQIGRAPQPCEAGGVMAARTALRPALWPTLAQRRRRPQLARAGNPKIGARRRRRPDGDAAGPGAHGAACAPCPTRARPTRLSSRWWRSGWASPRAASRCRAGGKSRVKTLRDRRRSRRACRRWSQARAQ